MSQTQQEQKAVTQVNWADDSDDAEDEDDMQEIPSILPKKQDSSNVNNSGSSAAKTTDNSSGAKPLSDKTPEPLPSKDHWGNDVEEAGEEAGYGGYGNKYKQDRGGDGYYDKRQGGGKYGNKSAGGYGGSKYGGGGGYNNRDGRDNREGRDNRGGERRQHRDGGGYGNRDFQYENRAQFDKFDQDQVDPESNYRKFYEKDPEFFLKVISKETAPFEFKIHLFVKEVEGGSGDSLRDTKGQVLQYLQENYDAEDISSSPMKKFEQLKLKFMFKVMDADKAYDLYKTINKMRVFPDTENRIQVYFLKTEAIFMKYADEEAAIYYEEQAKFEAQRQARQEKQFQQRGPKGGFGDKRNRRRDSREEVSHIANETGIKFTDKPVFTTTKVKSKEDDDYYQEVDEPTHRHVTYNYDASSKPNRSAAGEQSNAQGQGEQKYQGKNQGYKQGGRGKRDDNRERGGFNKNQEHRERRDKEDGEKQPTDSKDHGGNYRVKHQDQDDANNFERKGQRQHDKGPNPKPQRKRYNNGEGEQAEDGQQAKPQRSYNKRGGDREDGGEDGGKRNDFRRGDKVTQPQDGNKPPRGGRDDRGPRRGGGRGQWKPKADGEAFTEGEQVSAGGDGQGRGQPRTDKKYQYRKVKRNDGGAAGAGGADGDRKFQKQASTLSKTSAGAGVNSKNRFQGFGGEGEDGQ